MVGDGARRLLAQIQRVRALRDRLDADPSRAKAMATLRHWQAQRLSRTHADLLGSPRYGTAAAFFLSDLYGPGDFRQRDEDIERVYAKLVRVLPDRLIAIGAAAAELHAVSGELDETLLAALSADLNSGGRITEKKYAEAYRRCANFDRRCDQIILMTEVGRALDRVVSHPWIHRSLKMMRIPATLAGFSDLQDFLERGFRAFRNMGGAEAFLSLIAEREAMILERIYRDHPHPFARE